MESMSVFFFFLINMCRTMKSHLHFSPILIFNEFVVSYPHSSSLSPLCWKREQTAYHQFSNIQTSIHPGSFSIFTLLMGPYQ